MYYLSYKIYQEKNIVSEKDSLKFKSIEDIISFLRNSMEEIYDNIISYEIATKEFPYNNLSDVENYLYVKITNNKINHNFIIRLINIREYQMCLYELYGERLYDFVIKNKSSNRLIYHSYID